MSTVTLLSVDDVHSQKMFATRHSRYDHLHHLVIPSLPLPFQDLVDAYLVLSQRHVLSKSIILGLELNNLESHGVVLSASNHVADQKAAFFLSQFVQLRLLPIPPGALDHVSLPLGLIHGFLRNFDFHADFEPVFSPGYGLGCCGIDVGFGSGLNQGFDFPYHRYEIQIKLIERLSDNQ